MNGEETVTRLSMVEGFWVSPTGNSPVLPVWGAFPHPCCGAHGTPAASAGAVLEREALALSPPGEWHSDNWHRGHRANMGEHGAFERWVCSSPHLHAALAGLKSCTLDLRSEMTAQGFTQVEKNPLKQREGRRYFQRICKLMDIVADLWNCFQQARLTRYLKIYQYAKFSLQFLFIA